VEHAGWHMMVQLVTKAVLAGSIVTPWAPTIRPKNFTSGFSNSHLDSFMVN